MKNNLGQRILESLQKRGVTQKELASRIGITESTMSRYISGDRSPSPETLANIATALHTTSDYLLGIENDEFHFPKVQRLIARNASKMTPLEKKKIIEALLGEE